MNKLKGKDLIFISRIKKDGSGTIDISKDDMSFEDDTLFEINGLSLTSGTYIASRMSVYVVKLKPVEFIKQTPVQEMIEWLNSFDHKVKPTFTQIQIWANNLLEKERKFIMNVLIDGTEEKDPEYYYNSNFNRK